MELTQQHPPLQLHQANIICSEYQHLVGASYDKSVPGKGYIQCIVAAPYDTGYQWQITQFYLACNDPLKALQFYKGRDYVPLAISIPVLRKKSILYQDLREYLRRNDMPLNVIRYAQAYQ